MSAIKSLVKESWPRLTIMDIDWEESCFTPASTYWYDGRLFHYESPAPQASTAHTWKVILNSFDYEWVDDPALVLVLNKLRSEL